MRTGLPALFLVALSLAIGWGIRGNFGHEYGAMIPGALATLAAILVIARADWHSRFAYFAFFGALGWSLGGSISYMQVIAYTHSGHSASQLYGFASLFLIGFLWAGLGGAGALLPAYLRRQQLHEFFPPLLAIFAIWIAQDWAVDRWFPENPAFRQQSALYWFDTDWLSALTAIFAILVTTIVRRRIDFACSLLLHLAVGWWLGFLLLVNLLGWRMTPPRGDNWSGCVGMVCALLFFFQRRQLGQLLRATTLCGLIGGLGFATAQSLKLFGIDTGWKTNWHSLLEQSYGFFNGIGLALAFFWVARRAPKLENDAPSKLHWSGVFSIFFSLLLIPYLNLSKNPETWVKAGAMPTAMHGIPATTWFNAAFITISVAFFCFFARHRKQRLEFVPAYTIGQAQLLYLALLWILVIGNFERALVAFAEQRLVTEGIIFFNAAVCSVGAVVISNKHIPRLINRPLTPLLRWATVGALATMLSVLANWAAVRAKFGNAPIDHASKHIRFGPDATATKAKPKAGVAHP